MQERRTRLKQAVAVASREYLEHPCAVPDCPCMTLRLGLPQVDVIAEVIPEPKIIPVDSTI
jgi:hypothetical protein